MSPASAPPVSPPALTGVDAHLEDITILGGALAESLPATVRLDNGDVVAIEGVLSIGRDPAGDNVLAVHDDTKSVSKTHFSVEPLEGVWSLVDLHSTNGVTVTDVDGSVRTLTPGQPEQVPAGTSVRFGERSLVLGTAKNTA